MSYQYGCGADTCLVCYPYQYACAFCGARWDKPIDNGTVYECEDCNYINNYDYNKDNNNAKLGI